jgi:hypothetical protein
MSRNASGTYSLPTPQNPVVDDTPITTDWANTTLTDIATEITNSIDKGGRTTATANLPMGGFKHTSVANGSARDQYAALGQLQDSTAMWGGTAGGTADVLTITLTPAITAYATGQRFTFLTGASANATSTPTLNANGVGAKTIVRKDGSALQAGDMTASTLQDVEYDGTNFRLVPPIANTIITRTARTSNTSLASADKGKLFDVTSNSFTQTIDAASSLGNGWYCYYRNSGTGIVTIDPNGAETIDGSATVAVTPGIGFVLVCDGSNFYTIGRTNQGRTLISTITASASATVDVETTFDATYDEYELEVIGLIPATNNTILQALLKIGGSYVTSNYHFQVQLSNSSTASGSVASESSGSLATNAHIQLARNVGNAAADSVDLTIRICAPSSTAKAKTIKWHGVAMATAGTPIRNLIGAGGNTGTSAMTGIRFQMDSGNISSGTFRLYGLKNS